MNGWDRVIAATVARRAELGLTQKELALEAGVAERTIQNLEGGKRPQPLKRGMIEKALGWAPGEMDRMASAPEPAEPASSIPPDVLRVIRKRYDVDEQREIIEMLEQLSARAEQDEQQGRGASSGEGRSRGGGGASMRAV